MKKIILLGVICSTFFINTSFSTTWIGPDLVKNGDFEEGKVSWKGSYNVFQYTNTTTHYAKLSSDNPLSVYQTVEVETGKRYMLYGRGGGGRADVWADDIVSLPGWRNTQGMTTYQSAIGIAINNTTIIRLIGGNGSIFDHIKLQQVVYNPQIDILESELLFTEEMVYGSSLNVNLTLTDLSFADTPTDWWIDWGDGNVDYKPILNAISQHTYALSGGINSFTATLYGANQAGSMTDTVAITIVPEPATVLLLGLGGLVLRRRRV